MEDGPVLRDGCTSAHFDGCITEDAEPTENERGVVLIASVVEHSDATFQLLWHARSRQHGGRFEDPFRRKNFEKWSWH